EATLTLLCFLPRSDIDIDACYSDGLTRLIFKDLPAAKNPVNTPIGPDRAPFPLHRRLGLKSPLDLAENCRPVVRMQHLLPSFQCAGKLSWPQTVDRLQLRGPAVHFRLKIPFKRADGPDLLCETQTLFAFPQGFGCDPNLLSRLLLVVYVKTTA